MKISLFHVLARSGIFSHAHCNIISHVNIFIYGLSNQLVQHLSRARSVNLACSPMSLYLQLST